MRNKMDELAETREYLEKIYKQCIEKTAKDFGISQENVKKLLVNQNS